MAVYGLKPIGTRSGKPMVIETFTAGATGMHYGDLVKITAGLVVVAATTDTGVIGILVSGNPTTPHVDADSTCQVNVSPDLIVFADASAACTVGLSYAITGGTGVQYVDQSTAGDYNMYCIAVSPSGFGKDGDASTGLFVLKNTGTSV